MLKEKIFLTLNFLFLMILFSCRENIIDPNNPAGNKNLPVREEKENYFNITLNADKLTKEINFDLKFSSEDNIINLIVYDKQNGVCSVNVISSENKILFSSIVEISYINIRQRINRGIPAKVSLKSDNFTGKIKIVLSKSK